MSSDSNFEKDYMDDSSWDNLFEMAENYEEIEDVPVYKNVNFYENAPVRDERYHTPEEVLKVLFGYDSFRPGQKEVIESILSGKDAFAVMPTGAGKSVCYQVPAMLLPGITLVISPLISLMQDQVKALNEAGVSAAFINSALSENAYFETIRKAKLGLYKIIYVAPERLVTDGFLDLAQSVHISMVTVDEAHCISQWGQDFRSSYMKIVEFVKTLDNRPILSAFTATATETVRDDIVCTLGLNKPYVLVTGFDRDNLFFQVDKPVNKDEYVIDYISKHPNDSGIVYCATRKNVDKLYKLLKDRGVSVAKYHAGMGQVERKKMQDDFVFDYTSIVVATNAFGMGIDKSNVRFVIHYNMPQSMENYYQEAGRAGRDGIDSKCILLFSPQDIVINRFLLDHKEMSDLDPIDRETVKERDTNRLQIMERYCYTTECLRNYILKYFGENPEKPCEDCGNCLCEFETLDMTDAAKKIINCVYEAKGRYGKGIIIDTVAGAKTARLEEIGATEYKSYGILSTVNKNLLRRLIEQLVLEDYLLVGDYQVIKLGDITELKKPETTVLVKITDEDKRPNRSVKTKKTLKGMESLTSDGFKLFDKLRTLRLEIAREESMPPYIIFSDKTLIDMAVKIPTSKSEMLAVSGVGENKYVKYGERFLGFIDETIEEYPELIQTKEKNEQPTETTTRMRKKKKTGKEEFYLLQEEADNYKYSDYLPISDIRDEMNRICVRENVKKLPATRLTEILVEEGLIKEKEDAGKYAKAPTEKGCQFGVKVIEKVSEKGNAYTLLQYPREIQKMLVERFVSEEKQDEEVLTEIVTESAWLAEKREEHAGAYMPWTDEEDKKLTNEFTSGQFSTRDLSEIHGRTIGAIRARLKKLKLTE
ncbi:MAG: DNA helicase RecQ [Roseburia sp.]